MKKYLAIVLLLAVLLVPAVTKAQDQSVLASLISQLQQLVAQLTELRSSQTAQLQQVGGTLKQFSPSTPPTTVTPPSNPKAPPPVFTEISDWEGLNAIRDDLDGNFRLTGRLASNTRGWSTYVNLPNEGWVPIGTPSAPFTGTFDGGEHFISALKIKRPEADYQGLFGVIGSGASLSNVNVSFSEVIGRNHVGMLVGSSVGSMQITRSSAGGSVTGKSFVGGLIGSNPYGYPQPAPLPPGGQITRSYSLAEVIGEDYVGGLAGYNNGTISDSYAGHDLVGHAVGHGSSRYFGYPDSRKVGGLVGLNSGSGRIINSYSVALSSSGGLVAESNLDNVVSSYWDINSSGQRNSSGGAGRTRAQMTTVPRPLDTYVGWDFTNVWTQTNGGYPTLR